MTRNQICLTAMQCYIAKVAVTPSALRNMGGATLVEKAQEFLAHINRKPLSTIDPSVYSGWLDGRTEELMKELLIEGLWGPAMKTMNIFMLMASLNRFMCAAYALGRLEDTLEVPLDNRVAGKVLAWAKKEGLAHGEAPRWVRIKKLDPENSEKFQRIATVMAKEKKIPRGRLDVELWSRETDQL